MITVVTLNDKESLYLDCCASFNVDGKALISDDEYEKGRPVMSNEEYDSLRKKLKARNSPAVLHEASQCKVDDATRKVCKSDLYPDDGKNTLLYAPAAVLSALLFNEWAFWFKHWDPILSLVLGSPFIIGATYVLTNYIYFQSPYITKLNCPECGTLVNDGWGRAAQNVYFGDILFVNGKVSKEVKTQCVNKACGVDLEADRTNMVVISVKKR